MSSVAKHPLPPQRFFCTMKRKPPDHPVFRNRDVANPKLLHSCTSKPLTSWDARGKHSGHQGESPGESTTPSSAGQTAGRHLAHHREKYIICNTCKMHLRYINKCGTSGWRRQDTSMTNSTCGALSPVTGGASEPCWNIGCPQSRSYLKL